MREPRTIPQGAGVREVGSPRRLGRVMASPRIRGFLCVRWGGSAENVMVPRYAVNLVSKNYATAVAWDQAMAAGEIMRCAL